MIGRLIAWSARNLVLIFIGTAFVVAAGVYALAHCRSTPSPISPMCRRSSTQNIRARRRKSSRTRSPIR